MPCGARAAGPVFERWPRQALQQPELHCRSFNGRGVRAPDGEGRYIEGCRRPQASMRPEPRSAPDGVIEFCDADLDRRASMRPERRSPG